MYKIQEVADRLNVSYSVIYRLLRRGEMQCNRVGKAARISEEHIQAYLNRDKGGAAPDHGGLDLGIKCPKCEEELVRHRSENMIDDLQTRYSADCRKCGLCIKYQVVRIDADAAVAHELPDPRDQVETADQIDAELEHLAAQGAEQGAEPPTILEATPNLCPKCKGHPSGQFEQHAPADHEATLYCRTCNPKASPGLGLLYPVIKARASTPDDAMNAAVEAWNQAVAEVPQAPAQAPQVDTDTDTDTDTAPEEVTQ